MYETYYRFQEKPFSLTPDPRFLYLSKHHQGALDHMNYGIQQREGFMVVVGDVGTGKTTLCRCLLDQLDEKVEVALILNPMLSDMDLLRACVHDLRVPPLSSGYTSWEISGESSVEKRQDPDPEWISKASKKELIDALNAFLLKQHERGGTTVLIIDEAQNLSLEVMEQIRILSNLETEKDKLLQIIFVGQLELNDKLQLPELKQLSQRISIRYKILPLSRSDMENYIRHRILVVGGSTTVSFERSAMEEIYNYSQGYPRLINLVCDRALLAGYNAQTDVIDASLVKLGIRSLLGEEEKKYFIKRFLKFRVPVIASILFFLAGVLFFFLSQENLNWKKGFEALTVAFQSPGTAPVARGIAPALSDASSSAPSRPKVETADAAPVEGERGPVADSTETPKPPVSESPDHASPGQSGGTGSSSGDRTAGDEGYRIQVYSLSEPDRVESEVQKLRDEGYAAYWKKAVSMGRDWYIVYVGPFKKIERARIHLNALKYTGRDPILISVTRSG